TLDALRERYASEVPSKAFIRLRAALAEDHRAAEEKLREDAAAGATTVAELRAARARVATWRLQHNAVSALVPGFERVYRRGRRALRAASQDPTDEHLHELRKRSKDLWHAAQILRPAAAKELKKLGARAHRLSDLVGADHDLAVLCERADQRPEFLPEKGEAALLHSLIARRRGQIQRDALELAQRVFAAKPHKLTEPVARARAAQAR
ncbi:MAG: CHAD domain-containing protein, partial [Actinomycetota bacterium]|nr:CHAD domain-containing protein [Actinomycetota bacterium]